MLSASRQLIPSVLKYDQEDERMAKTVSLNKAHIRALTQEARRDMDNAIGERTLFKVAINRKDAEEEYEQTLLACADVLGGCDRNRGDFVLRDAEVSPVPLTDEALAWMKKIRDGSVGWLEDLATTSHEGGYKVQSREAFFVYVVDRVLAAEDEALEEASA